jgi:2-keto-4-pentenoate hydratase/2-oxohepta-3-ene-1,7-dioic acid hydratase in catechol pathway
MKREQEMKLAALRIGHGDESGLYVETPDGFAEVEALARAAGLNHLEGLRDVGELFALGGTAMDDLRALAVDAPSTIGSGEARFAPPVRRPGKIICVGLNYMDHITESGGTRPERIVLFAKYPNCLVGHLDDVRLPSITEELDYEGELAVIIGQRTSAVGVDDALSVIGGYTVLNDVSARDLQIAEPQWIRGKSLDTFAPLGPVVLDAHSAPPIESMRIQTFVNGELRQNALCSLMITPVAELIAHISQSITLEPGDIIATGTPSGVGLGMKPPVYLKNGDSMTVTIDAIGELTNQIVAY